MRNGPRPSRKVECFYNLLAPDGTDFELFRYKSRKSNTSHGPSFDKLPQIPHNQNHKISTKRGPAMNTEAVKNTYEKIIRNMRGENFRA